MFFFFNDTATTEIYTLSLHDALPIYVTLIAVKSRNFFTSFVPKFGVAIISCSDELTIRTECHTQNSTLTVEGRNVPAVFVPELDRKSTRLNSSHANISYAVFCLKKTT